MTTMLIAESVTVREYNLPESLADTATDKVAKVNRRLAKLGLPLYTVTAVAAEPRPIYDDINVRSYLDGVPHTTEDGRPVPCPIIGWEARTDITVTGDLPKLADWEPVAVITREQDGPVITRLWPGLAVEPNLARFRGRESECEHCRTARDRNDTYIVRHTVTGDLKQVGSNCLTAFTGIECNIRTWLSDAASIDELSELGGGGSASDRRWPVDHILTVTCAVVAKHGWISRTRALDSFGDLTATADRVTEVLDGRSERAREARAEILPTLPDHTARAALVLDHAAHLADAATGEYAMNLSAIAGCGWVGPRNLGLLCSAVAAYQRHEGYEVRRAQEAATPSVWQGDIKQRLTLSLTVLSTTTTEGYYGTTTIIALVDDAGNRFKWFASGVHDWTPGDRVGLKGTVKSHDEYRGVKETALTRCTVLTRTGADEPANTVA